MTFAGLSALSGQELASPDEGEAAQERQQPDRLSGHDDRIAYTKVANDTAGHHSGQEQCPLCDVAPDP